jgi:hypothetical protein
MKRSTLTRRTPLRRSRTPMKRSRPNPINRKRRAKLREEQFGEHADFIRSLGCCVCGSKPTEAAHVKSRGAGGTWRDTVPMCRGCHSRQHAIGIESFEQKSGVDLRALARDLADTYGG